MEIRTIEGNADLSILIDCDYVVQAGCLRRRNLSLRDRMRRF